MMKPNSIIAVLYQVSHAAGDGLNQVSIRSLVTFKAGMAESLISLIACCGLPRQNPV